MTIERNLDQLIGTGAQNLLDLHEWNDSEPGLERKIAQNKTQRYDRATSATMHRDTYIQAKVAPSWRILKGNTQARS